MEITILIDSSSWLNSYLPNFIKILEGLGHKISVYHKVSEMKKGDVAFFLSCFEIVKLDKLGLHRNNLVVHESNLPKGKGWSPMTWQVLEGKNEIPIALFEASEKVDAGDIYVKDVISLDGHELIEELREKQAEKTFELCLEFMKKYPAILEKATPQLGKETFYKKRTPKDSKLDIDKTIKEQFNLLRVVDNDKYPAFFEVDGQKYVLKISKCD